MCQSKAGRERSQEERTDIRMDHRSEEEVALIFQEKFRTVTTTS